MSDVQAMDNAAAQAGQSASIALQALVLLARAAANRSANAGTKTADPELARYAQAVREQIRPEALAEAVLNSPQWPQLAAELRTLERSGVDVRQFLKDAAPLVARIDADVRAAAPHPGVSVPPHAMQPRDPWAPPPNDRDRDRGSDKRPGLGRRAVERTTSPIREAWNRWRERRSPSALGDRAGELAAQGISPQVNARLVITAREAIADERVLGSLVTSRQWPAIAGQMNRLQGTGRNPREALAGVPARIQQAAAAGIRINAAEAAQGLLTEQAKTPPTPTENMRQTNADRRAESPAVQAAPTAVPAAPTPVPAPAAAPEPAQNAAAQNTNREVSYRWEITAPGENQAETLARGEAVVPAGPGERAAVEAVAAQQLANAARNVPAGDPRRGDLVFSAIGPGGSAGAVNMRGNDPKVTAAVPQPTSPSARTAAQAQARAAAANARSTTVPPSAAPGRSPATPAPAAKPPTPLPPTRSRTR
ncbi:hypothetical protein ACWCXH_33845 [Kitasatospora sp. NPDC001660]